MGPRPETPATVAAPAYQHYPEPGQNTYQVEQQLSTWGSSAFPANGDSYTSAYDGNYHYPEPPQSTKVDYGSTIHAPFSSSSPMHIPSMPSDNMTEMQTGAVVPVEGSHYTNSDPLRQFSQPW
ncbi:hypothetical protein O1611_g9167 [Lasiodiplodia mahajangana]|uniref:Uncharacterized protein n=1 Tax=Lasiodiplodia mahajangana TaxID=1108764 RepID=A0ACC2JAE4_9PEZI|nr:hypothetical protein O1611_g9167 [Lasiodiplodia mahajangana]